MQHLDEGTIHSWLDSELAPEDAARAEAHARECSECAALVAEARGLIAASTRILTALDDVPSRVVPAAAPARTRRWYDRTDIRAAAALLFVAGGSLIAVRLARNPAPAVRPAATMNQEAPLASPIEDAIVAPKESARREKVEPQASTNTRVGAVPAPPPAALKSGLRSMKVVGSQDEAAVSAGSVAAAGSVPGRIEGRVTDAQRAAGVAGASVAVQGTNLGTATDKDGQFRIDNVPAGEQRLIVRRIGYAAKTVPVSMNERVATANVEITPSETQLSNVVVTGVATTEKALNAPTSITVTSKSGNPLRQVRADSSGSTRSTVYEVAPGVQVTLVESPVSFAALGGNLERKRSAAPQAAAVPAPSPVNVIEWTDGNQQFTLTGPLTKPELEAIKARLMKMRQ